MGDLKANRTYTYDSLNRLTNARYTDTQGWSDGLGLTAERSAYEYDDLGNRLSHAYRGNPINPSKIAYEHDKANRMTLIDGLTQGYDLAGNVTLAYSADRGTSYIYKYDHNNRLTGVYNDTGTTRKAAFTYDALGRRIEHVNDVLGSTTRYYYDGVNEIVETDGGGDVLRYYVHGLSYVDERLMMANIDEYLNESQEYENRPYYFTLDRMYNVRFVIDRAGALVERYMYDAYGRPHIRESCGRGDMNNETTLTSTDDTRFTAAKNATIWDPRADMDDDGDIDANDQTAFDTKVTEWPPPTFSAPNVEWAFSVVGNPFMFQGRPHFALDTVADATEGMLMLNDHRARPEDVVTGRWNTRDPLTANSALILGSYGLQLSPTGSDPTLSASHVSSADFAMSFDSSRNPYAALSECPTQYSDPTGLANSCAFANGVFSWAPGASIMFPALGFCLCPHTSVGPACLGTCCDWWAPFTSYPCTARFTSSMTIGTVVWWGGIPICVCPWPTIPPGGVCGC